MEEIWKVGFLGLLVIAGMGLVMAAYGGQSDDVDAEVLQEVVEGAFEPDASDLCPDGCGNDLGTCGSDCGCGCQATQRDLCEGGCGLSACGDSCPRTASCGCGL
jgi:hypothetical protein